MLAALEHGVKGGKWFSLIDKVHNLNNLCAAVDKVYSNKGAPGVDHVTVEMFVKDLAPNLVKLRDGLREDTYQPQAIRRKWIPKPGSKEKRPLGNPDSPRPGGRDGAAERDRTYLRTGLR